MFRFLPVIEDEISEVVLLSFDETLSAEESLASSLLLSKRFGSDSSCSACGLLVSDLELKELFGILVT